MPIVQDGKAVTVEEAVKKPKKKKKWTPDFGSLADWKTRIRHTIIFYKGQPFYVEEIYRKKSKKLLELIERKSEISNEFHGVGRERQAEIKKELYEVLEPEIERLNHLHRTSKTGIKMRGTYFILGKDGEITHKNLQDISPKSFDYTMKKVGFVNSSSTDYLDDGGTSQSSEAIYVSRRAHRQYNHGICGVNVKFSSFSGRTVDITSDEFIKNSVLHSYPSLDECLDALFTLEGDNSKAFSKDFAVKVDGIGHVSLIYTDRVVGMSEDDGESFRLAGKYRYLQDKLEECGVTVVKKKEAA